MQAACGWTDSHLHVFEIDERTYAMGENETSWAEQLVQQKAARRIFSMSVSSSP
jgi:predicted transcriptional regulator YdeE